MDFHGKLKRIDEHLVAAHGRISEKINDSLGLSHYQFAGLINYGRWFLLLPIIFYLRVVFGDLDRGLAALFIISLALFQTLYGRNTIQTIRRLNRSDEAGLEVMPRSFIYEGPDRASRLGLLLGIIPCITLNGMAGMLSEDWGLNYLFINVAFSLDTGITTAVLYILAKPIDPKKGKLVKAFETWT
ncbi:MAG: hypothetical protein HYX86_01615, partial [Chloroflexi bacterium]|nr:hypothetical protein [Chloroflexota bacterium]